MRCGINSFLKKYAFSSSLISYFLLLTAYFLLLTVFYGCASTKEAKPAASQESNPPVAAAAVEESNTASSLDQEETKRPGQDEELLMPAIKQSISKKELPQKVEQQPIDPKRVTHVAGNVILNAEAMPLSDFVIYALGDTLKVTFFMDEQVKNMKNPITLRMTQEMPSEKVLEIVIGFLDKNDLTVEEKGGALYILKPKPVVQSPVDFRVGRNVPDSPATIVQIVPLKYFRAQGVLSLLQDLFKKVEFRLYLSENSLMITGPASSIKEVIDFIDLIDVPTLKEKKLFLTQLTYWQPDDFIKQITAILQGVGFPVAQFTGDAGVNFIPIKYLNSVLIISPDDTTLKYVLDWKKRLDTAESAGTEEKAFTFVPQYSRASDLVDSIRRLYGIMPAAPAKVGQATAPASATLGGALGAPAAPGGAPAAVPLPTAAAVSPVSAAAIPGLKISSDDRRNVVVIISTPSIYKSLLAILQELDKPPKQVLIEATIASLTLSDDLQYGIEWYLQNKMLKGTDTLQTLSTPVVSTAGGGLNTNVGGLNLNTATGLVYQFLSDSKRLQAAVNLFAQQNKLNVLSTPRIMVLDNQSASITVGSQVPVLSGSTTSSSIAATGVTVSTEAVQYVTTGIILTVTPTINTEGLLTLAISLEDSEAQTNTTSTIASPLITTQNLTTSVVASTSQTILLGGMITDSLSDTETKVPLFGDIPLIGNLFKTRSKSKNKTELIIMLTPHILTSGDEAARITNEIKKGIKWLQ
jgi:general secretion pathway protein D